MSADGSAFVFGRATPKQPGPDLQIRCAVCPAEVALPAVDGRIPLAPLAGWTFNDAHRWRCPEHSPQPDGSSS